MDKSAWQLATRMSLHSSYLACCGTHLELHSDLPARPVCLLLQKTNDSWCCCCVAMKVEGGKR